MSALNKIHLWMNRFRQRNVEETPAFIALTKEEIFEVSRNAASFSTCSCFGSGPKTVYGMPVHETEFAVEARERQLSIPYLHLEETERLSQEYSYQDCPDTMRRRLTQRVCAETTRLCVCFEWDCFAVIKRALRITRWFPVKTRTVLIDGRALYPHLKITLPFNKHYVTFVVNS